MSRIQPTTPVSGRRRQAFTLIEVLVVVAIIALLVAILLPSLNRARAQVRAMTCQSNMRQLALGFLTYAAENKGSLPGAYRDGTADWLGPFDEVKKVQRLDQGRIYKYVGRAEGTYVCPDDQTNRDYGTAELSRCFYSYTSNELLSGAKTEMLSGAHYVCRAPFDTDDHTVNMAAMEGVPILIEEDPNWCLARRNESSWANVDAISGRHLKSGSGVGSGNLVFHDGHAGRIKLAERPLSHREDYTSSPGYFCANDMCIRTIGGKWVSGRSWKGGGRYGWIAAAPPASAYGVEH